MTHDPVTLARVAAQTTMNSRRYIERFTALDTNPVVVTDDASQAARDYQLIVYCKRICGAEMTQDATATQLLALHHTFMKGWM